MVINNHLEEVGKKNHIEKGKIERMIADHYQTVQPA